MEIVFHEHHAEISERMRIRARRAVQKVVRRIPQAVDAIVRFEQDGPTRRVEVSLRIPRGRDLVAKAEGRWFGPALSAVIARLVAQLPKKSPATSRARDGARQRRTATA